MRLEFRSTAYLGLGSWGAGGHLNRQRGRESKGFFYYNPDHLIWVQPAPYSHIVASLDKTLCDDYLSLAASNKQLIQWTRIRRNPQEHWISGNS